MCGQHSLVLMYKTTMQIPTNFSKLFHRAPSLQSAQPRVPLEWLPFRVWRIVVITFFTGLLLLGGFHFYLWRAVNNTAQPDVSNGGKTIPLRADVTRAQEILQAKETEYKALLLTRPHIIDPSR